MDISLQVKLIDLNVEGNEKKVILLFKNYLTINP